MHKKTHMHNHYIAAFVFVFFVGMGVMLLGAQQTGFAVKDITEIVKPMPIGTCPEKEEYVCGEDGMTYRNPCQAYVSGMYEFSEGAC
ncbi:hypothetical protein HY486_02415 [Candidatus Woesearchaeota archaeon]|nr:hypothetical protein [Candidatus Woesearchaeota archaeon]